MSTDFGGALVELKHGKKMCRKGWNGKNQFVYLVPGEWFEARTDAAKSFANLDNKVKYNSYMAIHNADDSVNTWVPSSSDCLAEDWIVFPE